MDAVASVAVPSPPAATPRAPARPGPRRGLLSAGALVAAAVLAVSANLLADRLLPRSARLDLTEQRLYTLSEGTRGVLAGLREPVTLRLFYSRRLGAAVPAYGSFHDRVRETLAEYVALSGGRLRLEALDPEPFSEVEDRALSHGLQGVPLDAGGEQVYFGLVGVNPLDDERTIPFLQPDRERFLEYDLTRLVYDLSSPRRPALGVLSSLPLDGDPRAMMMRVPGAGGGFAVMNQLRQFFAVRQVERDAAVVAPDVQVMLVAHPQGLSDTTLYALDQFVMRGGRLMVLVDPHSEGQASRPDPTGRPQGSTASSLDRLLNAWGVEAPSNQVVLDGRGAWRVRANPNDRVGAVDYVAWFNVQGDGIARADVASAELNSATVASAGEVRRREGSSVEFTPILSSSAERSGLMDAARVREAPDPARVLADFRPDGGARVLLARVRGVLDSAFPDGPPRVAEGAERPADFPAHRTRTEGPANLVVGNDADLLEDRFWVRVQDFFGQQVATPFGDNGALVTNLLDTLAGGDALISLRSRGESLRPFAVVEDMRRDAEARFRQTERELTTRLEATERRLRELRGGSSAAGGERQPASAVVTAEQRAEIDRAREEIVATRRELRAVQLDLRRDIEALERTVRAANIAAVPALLVVVALVVAVARSRRRAAARA